MKTPCTLSLLAFATFSSMTALGGLPYVPQTASVAQYSSPLDSTWSGSIEDLKRIVDQAKDNYGFENSKHLGRNATDLKPSTLQGMRDEIEKYGNADGWVVEPLNWSHQPGLSLGSAIVNGINYAFGTEIDSGDYVKYTNPSGGEVVYDRSTGRIIQNELMGTKNFESDYRNNPSKHKKLDMYPHYAGKEEGNSFSFGGNQYKFVGILYERDPNDPSKYYLVDGQTGKRMTNRQAKEFPTTLSDMWKDQGLMCVANDAKDYEQTPQPTPQPTINTAAALDAKPAQPVQTDSGMVNLEPALTTEAAQPVVQPATDSAHDIPAVKDGDDNTEQQPPTVSEGVKDPIGQTPEEVAIAYLKSLYARDMKRLKEIMSDEWAEVIDEALRENPNRGGRRDSPSGNMTYKVAQKKIGEDGDVIEFEILCREQGASKEYKAIVDLQIIGGRWRVVIAALDADSPFDI